MEEGLILVLKLLGVLIGLNVLILVFCLIRPWLGRSKVHRALFDMEEKMLRSKEDAQTRLFFQRYEECRNDFSPTIR